MALERRSKLQSWAAKLGIDFTDAGTVTGTCVLVLHAWILQAAKSLL